jgi:hypothetical protein
MLPNVSRRVGAISPEIGLSARDWRAFWRRTVTGYAVCGTFVRRRTTFPVLGSEPHGSLLSVSRHARSGFARFVVAAILFLLGTAASAQARPYTLRWDANFDGLTTGYLISYGTASGVYGSTADIDVGNVTSFQVDLNPGTTYFFIVKAYDAAHQVGPSSTELSFYVPIAALTVSSASAGGGATVSVAALGPGNRLDRIGLYAVGSNTSLDWKYLNGTQTPPANGLTTATVPFVMPGTSGQYEFRFLDGAGAVLATSPTVTVSVAPSVTPSATTVAGGTNLTATVANGPGNRLDWVALYPVGSNAAVDWQYLNGTRTPPVYGVTGATLTFSTPTAGGQFVLKLFSGNASMFVATSATVTVTVGTTNTVVTGSPSVTPSATSVAGGDNLTATVANGPGNRLDWVALYPVGSNAAVDWLYLNGTRTPPSTGVTGVALTFTMPTSSGQYVLRLFSSSKSTFVASSATVTVTGTTNTVVTGSPSVTPSATSITAGSNLTATVANGPGNRLDWVALYPVGSNAAVDWQYLNGTRTPPSTGVTGVALTFTMPTADGQFVLKLFSSNASAFVATSATVTVTGGTINTVVTGSPSITPSATTVASGSNLTVTIANGPGNRLDWVAMYPVGSSSFVDWQYLNGARTPPVNGVTGVALTFSMPTKGGGQYVLLFFSSKAASFVATSPTITVQ